MPEVKGERGKMSSERRNSAIHSYNSVTSGTVLYEMAALSFWRSVWGGEVKI